MYVVEAIGSDHFGVTRELGAWKMDTAGTYFLGCFSLTLIANAYWPFVLATGLTSFIGSTVLVLFIGDFPWNHTGPDVLYFQQSVDAVYSGIMQALLFGWLYVAVVWIWERTGTFLWFVTFVLFGPDSRAILHLKISV